MRGGFLALVAALGAGAAWAGPAAAPLVIENRGAAAIACRATIAHWYLLEFGPVAPGARVTLPLRYDAASERVSILNAPGAEMAVERLTCGAVGEVWATGAELPWRALAARAAAGGAVVACRAGTRTICAEHGS